MPSRAYWIAVAFVRRRTAPLEAWYCGLLLSVPTSPSWDEMLMIDPPPARRMAGMTALVPRNTPLALTSIMRSQSSTVVSSMRPPPPMPALFTRTFSRAERLDRQADGRAASRPRSVTSSRTKTASPPFAVMSASTARPSASRMSPMTTRAPSRANSRASRRAHAARAAADQRHLSRESHGRLTPALRVVGRSPPGTRHGREPRDQDRAPRVPPIALQRRPRPRRGRAGAGATRWRARRRVRREAPRPPGTASRRPSARSGGPPA